MPAALVILVTLLTMIPRLVAQEATSQPTAEAAVEAAEKAAQPKLRGDVAKRAKKAVDLGLRFLRRAWDAERPAEPPADHLTHWGHPGVTALALTAFYRCGHRRYNNEDGPFIREPFEHLLSLQRPDGAINDQEGMDNYITCVAMMALQASGEDVAPVLDRASAFLTGAQLDEGEGYKAGDKFYGGQGYGSSQRPDLSNTQLAIEALHGAGLPADDEFFKKAMVFIGRCQNSSETNDLESFKGDDGEVYVPGDDGGFIYYPGRSEAEELVAVNPDGSKSLRSYGSMTYAGLKSMIYAGLSPDDPRVQSALSWIQGNYRLDENPGAGQQGLFYYYHTFARALDAASIEDLEDADGEARDWRADLAEALMSRQQRDGSWINGNPRWWEGNPVLVTAYSVLALETLLGD